MASVSKPSLLSTASTPSCVRRTWPRGKCEWMGRAKDCQKEKSSMRRKERSDFLGPLAVLIFPGDGGFDVPQRLARQTSREERKPRALSSSFPLSSSQEGNCLAVGRGGPSSPQALRVESHAGSSQREPNACSQAGPAGL